MNAAMIDKIVEAVLYEGYVLYPYRPSSVKNRHRWTFGGIYPKPYSEATGGSDPWMMQAQCLIDGSEDPRFQVTVRFLQPTNRTTLPEGQTWQEAIERRIEIGTARLRSLSEQPQGATSREGEAPAEPRPSSQPRLGGSLALPSIESGPAVTSFCFPYQRTLEEKEDAPGSIVREQYAIAGVATLSAQRMSAELFQITIRVENRTETANPRPADRDAASLESFASTHMILTATAGQFVSLTDPPAPLASVARHCKNIGCWPVLVGQPGENNTLLASPIILSDYPEIAAESPGDLFDGTEIDEILSLRIMTMTDDEKRQAGATDERVRAMLARTDALARDELMSLHGTIRGLKAVQASFHDSSADAPGGRAARLPSAGDIPSRSEQRHA
jgi:hypothetical protein